MIESISVSLSTLIWIGIAIALLAFKIGYKFGMKIRKDLLDSVVLLLDYIKDFDKFNDHFEKDVAPRLAKLNKPYTAEISKNGIKIDFKDRRN